MQTAPCAIALLPLLISTAEAGAAPPKDRLAQTPVAPEPASAAPARAQGQAPVALTLRDAIERALRSDPQVLAAVVQVERSQLGVLRAQLDRFSLRSDASLSEQFRMSFGQTTPASCAGLLPLGPLVSGASGLATPLQVASLDGNGVTSAQCSAAFGALAAYQDQSSLSTNGIGLFNVSANLQVPFFSGFRVTATVERARLTKQAADAQVKSSARQVALDVLRSYWAIRRVELQQEVSRRALERLDEAAQVVQSRVRAGLVAPVEQNRIETRRQREQARLRDLIGQAAESRAQLAVALGLGSADLQLSEDATVPPPPPGVSTDAALPVDPAAVDRLLDDARRERPELLQARRNTEAALQSVRIAQSGYYPQLGGQALLQFGNNPFNPLVGARAANNSANPFTNVSGSLFVGATLSINLFDTLNTYTSVRDARYEVRRLEQEERRLGRLVEADVRTAQARLGRLYSYREPLLRTRELAADSLGVIERRYRNGDALILDYIDAQVDLLNAEIDLANSAAAIAQAWGELYAATGRLPR